jgi:hypothetical protein
MNTSASVGRGAMRVPLYALVVAGIASPAMAGGGFSGSSGVTFYVPEAATIAASQSQSLDISGQYGSYTSKSVASANTAVSSDDGSTSVNVRTGYVSVANTNGAYFQQSTSVATSLTKGTNSIAKGRTDTHTVITAGGKQYLVVDEVARALARITDFSSSAAASADVSFATGPGGYGATSVNTHATQRGQ